MNMIIDTWFSLIGKIIVLFAKQGATFHWVIKHGNQPGMPMHVWNIARLPVTVLELLLGISASPILYYMTLVLRHAYSKTWARETCLCTVVALPFEFCFPFLHPCLEPEDACFDASYRRNLDTSKVTSFGFTTPLAPLDHLVVVGITAGCFPSGLLQTRLHWYPSLRMSNRRINVSLVFEFHADVKGAMRGQRCKLRRPRSEAQQSSTKLLGQIDMGVCVQEFLFPRRSRTLAFLVR